ncbi:MAG: fumarate hydratase [Acidobacteria bacterium]|nr:MAG: fumarate hydratase [Acidobacteriota bacterium]
MRTIDVQVLTDTTARLLVDANYRIPPDILSALRAAALAEESDIGRQTLAHVVRNYEVAEAEQLPVCQDSGVTVVLLETGQDVHWTGGSIEQAIFAGIRQGTSNGYLRMSVVGDPLARLTPAGSPPGVIHYDIVDGEGVRLTVASKGFGAENMSALRMFAPADGSGAVKDFVVETVDRAGANACPPVIVGVGVGGTFEKAALLAKKAVLRPIDQRHPRAATAALEAELLKRINDLGVGPQGLGGTVTALAVNVEVYPTHIAGLPVAVNIGCHSNRRTSIAL